MKQTSTFQIILLSSFGALALAAVLIFSFFLSKSSSSVIGPVSIWGTLDQASVQQVIDNFSATQPNLESARYTQKDAATYLEDLTNAFASGGGPDLFFITEDETYMQRNRIKLIAPESLSLSQFQNSFIDGAAPFATIEGTSALPLLADPLVMYWNKDLLAASGKSQPPQYWDQLFDFSREVTKRNEDGAVRIATIAFGTYDNVDHAKEILSLLIYQAGGSITSHAGNGILISGLSAGSAESGVPAVPAALRFYTGFADSSKQDYSWNRSLPDSQKAFTAGSLALYIGLASEKAAIIAANPNLNFGVASVPQIRNGSTQANSGRVHGVAVAKNAVNPIGGYTVAAIMASGDFSAALSTAFGMPSARRDILERAIAQPNQGLAPSEANIIAAGTILMRTWTDPDPVKTDDIFRAMIEDTTSGALLLNEAISRAEQQINNLIEL